MRKILAALVAAVLLPAGTAGAQDPPCVTADGLYETATGAYGGFCDLEYDAHNAPRYVAGFTLVCDKVNGTVMGTVPVYESGSAPCMVAGASDDFDWVHYAASAPAYTASFRYWSVTPGTLERSEGWFRIDIPELQELWMQGNYVRTHAQWVLQGVIVHNAPGRVLRTAAFGGPGEGLPTAPVYPFAMAGAVTHGG